MHFCCIYSLLLASWRVVRPIFSLQPTRLTGTDTVASTPLVTCIWYKPVTETRVPFESTYSVAQHRRHVIIASNTNVTKTRGWNGLDRSDERARTSWS